MKTPCGRAGGVCGRETKVGQAKQVQTHTHAASPEHRHHTAALSSTAAAAETAAQQHSTAAQQEQQQCAWHMASGTHLYWGGTSLLISVKALT